MHLSCEKSCSELGVWGGVKLIKQKLKETAAPVAGAISHLLTGAVDWLTVERTPMNVDEFVDNAEKNDDVDSCWQL